MTLLTLVLVLALVWLIAMIFSPSNTGMLILRVIAGIAILIYLLRLFGIAGRVGL